MPPQIPQDPTSSGQGYAHTSWNDTNADEATTREFQQQAPAPEAPRSPMSRRSILRGVAGVGVVGAAAAVGAGAIVEFDHPSNGQPMLKPLSKPVAVAPMAPSAMAGPLVVYIADTSSGEFDVFGGTGQTQIRNPALVNQLLANLKLA